MRKESPTEYAHILLELTREKNGEDLKKAIWTFLSYLSKQKAYGWIDEITEAFKELKDKEEGVVDATLYSAEKLTDHAKHEIVEALKKETKAEKVELIEKIDETLIAGWKIRTKEFMIDGSVKGRLKQLEAELTK